MHHFCLFLTLFLFLTPSAMSQDSIITTLHGVRPALVKVIAQQGSNYQQGAGVIIDAQGTIVTNTHIIHSSQNVYVEVYNGSKTIAKVISISPNFDLSLIKINTPEPLQAIEWGNSNQLSRGTEVINIGNSYLNNNTLSVGHVRRLAFSRTENDRHADVMEVTIPLFKGDSGGPLLNREGQFVGLVSARHNRVYRSSFAITSNKVLSLYQCVKERGEGCLILE